MIYAPPFTVIELVICFHIHTYKDKIMDSVGIDVLLIEPIYGREGIAIHILF